MKTTLLALMLVLTGFELSAQLPPNATTNPAERRLPRYGFTNGVPRTQPRYQPAAPAAAGAPEIRAGRAAGGPGGLPGTPGAAGGAPAAATPTAATGAPGEIDNPDEMIAPGLIDFEGVDVNEVLNIYAKLVNRTLLRAQLPQSQIILKTQTPLTKKEAIEALQAVLALNGISVINIGDKFVKVLPSDQAGQAGEEVNTNSVHALPELGSYVTRVVQLKYVKPSEMVPVIQPFAKLPNSILAIDGNGILVLRDYTENVKRMLEMIDKVDVSVPAEYVSEVIPIRYAKVDDIANALNALGGGGGATVSIGTARTSTPISGLAPNRSSFGGMNSGMGGMGGMGGIGGMNSGMGGIGGMGGAGGVGPYGGQTRTYGATTPNGTPSGGTSFQQRLRNIINATSPGGGGAAGGNQEIQLFGQTKIIPNESSSSLLIYATRQDMEVIKGIIAKLDVPLAQVLIEAVIIDVTLGNNFNLGVSAAQNPVANGAFIGGGGMNNASSGNPFIDFVRNVTQTTGSNGLATVVSKTISTAGSTGTNSGFANNLPGGMSYFANIGPNWDVALTAAESDSHASIIQRPRIQTSQATPAQFFVGDTVPYVTSSYGGYGGYGYGNSYSQLSVGVELDVTPFINPEGLVSMDIQQEIDDLNGYTAITGVGNVPNTIKRTLSASITVRDRDTVMLGGFIKSDKSHSKSGVPFLQDIPLLGNLFTSRSDSKDRQELIVLMRPTVLPTPELAAKNTVTEEKRLPTVSEAAAEDAAFERKLIDAQRKHEERNFKATGHPDGFFVQPSDTTGTNNPATQPGESEEEVNPVMPAVHPQANVAPSSPAPAAPGNNAAPLDAAAAQQKAAAALSQKMLELNSTNAPR